MGTVIIMKYVVYFLERRDFSENPEYTDYKIVLEEAGDYKTSCRFDTKEEAVNKINELKEIHKKHEFTIVEVY